MSETPLHDDLIRDFGAQRSEVPALVSTFCCIVGKFPGSNLKSAQRCRLAGYEPDAVWRRALQIVRTRPGAA